MLGGGRLRGEHVEAGAGDDALLERARERHFVDQGPARRIQQERRAAHARKARLTDEQRSKQTAAQAESRRLQVGSGDRSQRIRTYNFPQGRITDHRVNLTLYSLPAIIGGDLDPLLGPLTQEYQADQMKSLTEGGLTG